ncbi:MULTISPECIES: ATP-binding protein [Streptomycetaceae]|uniref:Histidine kinase/HSP90-like ATPase domain-containing protein n=1 Tax=Streptantibioticus cattleyicolor (strain ATCC 35852 / DSM 46488 / JCM 4925 / NBRC 14057 / NRRL 8057) TaxID=1003195 RepID=F8K3K1_STREN|nr:MULTISPECIES: ATP-binding protein [Streptomycetaceae]AEW96320.1 hypothetical protein SCATT_39490 [Streptantibioticus cattleyicolor NRRL 8057 = DSM 46488]MYS60835.1 ATP-binding protein [Streptomyces sp. SID5468]CCB76659.1 Regulatory protein [Streptantibioticus cattleyicolor NRRL 8057 = DSM 46488]
MPPDHHEPLPESWSYGLYIPHDPRAVRVARATIRCVLGTARLERLTDTAELLLSEVVTNAYRYSTADVYVAMDWVPHQLEVHVFDTGPLRGVAERHGDGLAESGRGLPLVAACADAWGVRTYGGDGKSVWFRMAGARD